MKERHTQKERGGGDRKTEDERERATQRVREREGEEEGVRHRERALTCI